MYLSLLLDRKILILLSGSKYKFRVMAASISGISEASPESEEVMIGECIVYGTEWSASTYIFTAFQNLAPKLKIQIWREKYNVVV